MRRPAALALSTLTIFSACAADDDETIPSELLAVEQAGLEAAELSFEPRPLDASEIDLVGSTRFGADDSLAPDGEIDVIARVPAGARFGRDAVVAIRWGYFPPREADEWKEWNGFVAISEGAVDLVRPLRFENDREPPHRPFEDFAREGVDPRVVRFRSHTRPAWDGVLVHVRRPSLAPAVLVIRAGDVTRVLPFEELFDLDVAEVVDDAGHELRIRAHTPSAPDCAIEVGEAVGRWGATGDDTGLFRGALTIDDETLGLAGHTVDVRGPYGRFQGRIGEDGAPVGGVRGFYAAFRYAPGRGMLFGVARGDGGDARGALVGGWRVDPDAGDADAIDAGFRARLIRRDPSCGVEDL